MNEFLTKDALFPIIIGTCVFSIFIIFIILFIINYQKKQQDFEQEREEFKKALLETEIEIKEQTLTNISRELHDNIGQIASLIKINLNLLSKDLSEADQKKVQDSIELSKQLIKDVKALSVSLKSENLERFGLIKMMEKDIKRYKAAGKLKIDFDYPSSFSPLKADTEIILYRMSQEIFNNVLKHANASFVNIQISEDSKNVIFSFKDNGKGFNMNAVELGSGLLNLQERCKLVNAKLKMDSEKGKGTLIEIKIEKD
ncbi:MAG: sensor histidine kinase [Crocinitomicaceae bacterium]